jgi:hypothetical protein
LSRPVRAKAQGPHGAPSYAVFAKPPCKMLHCSAPGPAPSLPCAKAHQKRVSNVRLFHQIRPVLSGCRQSAVFNSFCRLWPCGCRRGRVASRSTAPPTDRVCFAHSGHVWRVVQTLYLNALVAVRLSVFCFPAEQTNRPPPTPPPHLPALIKWVFRQKPATPKAVSKVFPMRPSAR